MNYNKALPLVLGAIVAASLAGCARPEADEATNSNPSASFEAAKAASQFRSDAPLHEAARQPGAQRNVMRSASLTMHVAELEKSEQKIKNAVNESGGYVATEYGSDLGSDEPSLQLTLRVPEKKFDNIIAVIEAEGRRVEKTVQASDLTEQMLDVEAALQAAKKNAARPYRSVDLERLKGELINRTQMSTIQLTMKQRPNAALGGAAASTWSSDTWNSAVNSGMATFRFIGAIAIWLLVYSPIWGLILVAATWGMKAHRRNSQLNQRA